MSVISTILNELLRTARTKINDNFAALNADKLEAADITGKVDKTTTVNGHALSGNVTVTNADLGAVPTTRQVNGHALSADVTITKSDVGLSNVTNDAQLKAADLDVDGTLAANSDTKIASQKAVKTYVDGHSSPYAVVGYQRILNAPNQTTGAATAAMTGADGTNYFYVTGGSASAAPIIQLIKFDPNTFICSGSASNNTGISVGGTIGNGGHAYASVLGSFVYVSYRQTSGAYALVRFNALTLASPTSMTISGTSPTVGAVHHPIFSDGTYLYICDGTTPTQINKYSVSGTTATFVSSITFTSFNGDSAVWCDGTNVYQCDGSTLRKWALAGGSTTATTTVIPNGFSAGLFTWSQNANIFMTVKYEGSGIFSLAPITKI